MVERKPAVPGAKPYTGCRIRKVLLLHYLPLGQQMEYIVDTQTQRDIHSTLISTGSLLCDDLRKMHSLSLYLPVFERNFSFKSRCLISFDVNSRCHFVVFSLF